MFDPFGGMPFNLAGSLRNQFTNPLTKAFGWGGGSGPLATFAGQGSSFLPSYLPTLQNLSGVISGGASSAYGGYQSAVDQFMKSLPAYEGSINTATGGAGTALDAAKTDLADAMSPLQSRATYQEAARRALAPAREGEAARGMVEGGQGQAGEQSLLSDLAFKTLQSDEERRQAAISGVSGAAGTMGQLGATGAGVAGMGPEAMSALFSAYPQLASLLQGAAQMPMQGMGDLLSFFTGAMSPEMELLKMVLPQMGQKSKSLSLSQSTSAQV